MSTTHTFALLDVSAAAYEEIKKRLEAVNYQHAFHEVEGRVVIDMSGIALQRETDERVKVFLVYEGKKV